ncbi:hypothetical protein L3556_02655 [Candidatus Synechococcus calcipolaris G9]|uniref:Uncharacterized protein n=1 Tax=Candidatus Synechococcus calcipolaris G9 TaxID=1497997 RepID=A0ABT6EX74_9SYNE|nr:hypothetical protein [Candidatus Synechococcus calcipolaris]MDG2989841.1 hypothetical protein [Candidatus Synechococcus calcipolaris G9]
MATTADDVRCSPGKLSEAQIKEQAQKSDRPNQPVNQQIGHLGDHLRELVE